MKHLPSYLTEIEFWLVGTLIAASMVFERLFPLAVGTAILFWVARLILPGCRPHRTPADLAVILLLLTIPITCWVTINPELTLIQVERLASGIALMYVIVNWARTTRHLLWLFGGAILVGAIVALTAPVSVDWDTTKFPFLPYFLYDSFKNLLPDRVHPNVMGGFLILFGVFPASGLLFTWRRVKFTGSILLLAAGGIITFILLLTQSRGAWIAFSISLLFLITLRWRWGWVIAAVTSIGGYFAFLGFRNLTQVQIAIGSILRSFDGRLDIWDRALFMIRDFPVTGVGMGNFGEIVGEFYPLAGTGEALSISHAHNLFLQIAVDLGLPGLIAWLAIFSTVIFAAWKIYQTPDLTGFLQAYGAGLICSQVALFTHGLLDSVIWGMIRPAPLIWGLWGMALAGYSVSRSVVNLPDPKLT